MDESWFLPLAGFAGGTLLGLASQAGRFCTHGAIEDVVFGGDSRRLRMALLGLALAMGAVFALSGAGVVDLSGAALLVRPLPLAAVAVGAFLFGIGMALVGTCAFGSLARLGSGDLGGLLVVGVVGVTGYSAASGVLGSWLGTAPPRSLADAAPQGLAHDLSTLAGLPVAFVGIAVATALAAAVLSSRSFRAERAFLGWSVVIALGIVSGWWATGIEAASGFSGTGATSHSFVRPLGESVIVFMTGPTGGPTFGIGAMLGVIAGGAAGSLWRGTFQWQACDDARTFRRHLLGAALMGVGGVLAFGCTIGQGLTAASVLAWSAPVAMLGMFAGSWLVLQWMVRGTVTAPLLELLRRA